MVIWTSSSLACLTRSLRAHYLMSGSVLKEFLVDLPLFQILIYLRNLHYALLIQAILS